MSRPPLPVIVPLAIVGTIIGGAGLALIVAVRIIEESLRRN